MRKVKGRISLVPWHVLACLLFPRRLLSGGQMLSGGIRRSPSPSSYTTDPQTPGAGAGAGTITGTGSKREPTKLDFVNLLLLLLLLLLLHTLSGILRNRIKPCHVRCVDKAESKGRGRSRRDKKEKEEEEDDGPILPRYRTWEEAQAAVEAADRWGAGDKQEERAPDGRVLVPALWRVRSEFFSSLTFAFLLSSWYCLKLLREA